MAVTLALWLAPACALQDAPSPASVESFHVGRIPRDVIFDGRHIWVANMGSDSVSKLDLDGQLIAEFPAGSLPQALAFDGSNLWVTTATGDVLKLSTDGETLSRLNVGGILTSAVFDGGQLWVANIGNDTIVKLDADGQVLLTVPVVTGAGFSGEYRLGAQV